MSGFQDICHIGREGQIQLMAYGKSSGIESIITSQSVYFQQIPARVIIRIRVIILYKPLRIERINLACLQIILPASLRYNKHTLRDIGHYIECLMVFTTHGSQRNLARDRVRRVISSEILTEEQCPTRTYIIGYLVRPWMSERRTAAFYLLHIYRLAYSAAVRQINICRTRYGCTIPSLVHVFRAL